MGTAPSVPPGCPEGFKDPSSFLSNGCLGVLGEPVEKLGYNVDVLQGVFRQQAAIKNLLSVGRAQTGDGAHQTSD